MRAASALQRPWLRLGRAGRAAYFVVHSTRVLVRINHDSLLVEDRLVQRPTFRHPSGDTTITVNFCTDARSGFPARSATVAGPIHLTQTIYLSTPREVAQ